MPVRESGGKVTSGGKAHPLAEDETVVVMAEAPQLAIVVYEYVRQDEADHTTL